MRRKRIRIERSVTSWASGLPSVHAIRTGHLLQGVERIGEVLLPEAAHRGSTGLHNRPASAVSPAHAKRPLPSAQFSRRCPRRSSDPLRASACSRRTRPQPLCRGSIAAVYLVEAAQRLRNTCAVASSCLIPRCRRWCARRQPLRSMLRRVYARRISRWAKS